MRDAHDGANYVNSWYGSYLSSISSTYDYNIKQGLCVIINVRTSTFAKNHHKFNIKTINTFNFNNIVVILV